MSDTVWKPITDLSVPNVDSDRYEINNYGDVWDKKSNRFLTHSIDDEGYHRVHIHTLNGYKSKYIHRLVKIEFDGFDTDSEKNQIDHVDCNKSNNNPHNLEWVTREENALRAIKNNLYKQFDVKMSEDDVEFICQQLKQGKNYKYISDLLYPKYNRDIVDIIGKIYRGERWKHISKKYMPFPELEKDPKKIPSTSVLTEEIIHDICKCLDQDYGIVKTARFIQSKYNISRDLEDSVASIKHGRSFKHISKDYSFIRGGNDMAKPNKNENSFEESIRNYGDKIEHIDSFAEAVRRLPGKYTARHIRNDMKIKLL